MSSTGSGTLNILVLDLAAQDRATVENTLAGAGHELICATLAEAPALLEQGIWDVVLLDVLENPEAALKTAQLIHDTYEIPILALADTAPGAQIGAFFAAGIDDFIPRPFDAQVLREAVGQSFAEDSFSLMLEEETDEPFNSGRIDELFSFMGAAKATALIATFIEDAADSLARLPDLAGNREAVAAELHKLVATAANIGLDRLAAGCRELKDECADLPVERYDPAIKDLEAQYRHGVTALCRFLEVRNGL